MRGESFTHTVTASYPDVSLQKNQWARKGGRERLVYFFLPWSLALRACHQSLALRARHAKRLRRRLIQLRFSLSKLRGKPQCHAQSFMEPTKMEVLFKVQKYPAKGTTVTEEYFFKNMILVNRHLYCYCQNKFFAASYVIYVSFQDVHNQETKKYRGETIEGPKQLHFKDGGGDLLVKLTNRKPGWNTSATRKVALTNIISFLIDH